MNEGICSVEQYQQAREAYKSVLEAAHSTFIAGYQFELDDFRQALAEAEPAYKQAIEVAEQAYFKASKEALASDNWIAAQIAVEKQLVESVMQAEKAYGSVMGPKLHALNVAKFASSRAADRAREKAEDELLAAVGGDIEVFWRIDREVIQELQKM